MTDVTYYRQILHDQTEFLNSKIEKYLKILDDELDQLPESGKFFFVLRKFFLKFQMIVFCVNLDLIW